MNELQNQGELKRTLSLPLLIGFGLAYLAPTVVFNYYGIWTADSGTGGHYPLALLIATVLMTFTAYSYTRMVKEYPTAGSAYVYVNKSVQPHIGFLTGWVMLLDYLLLPMVCYLLIGIYVNEYFPALPVWVIVVGCAALGAVFNIVGVKTASIIDSIIIAAQIIFTIVTIILCIMYVCGTDGLSLLSSRAIVNKWLPGPFTFILNKKKVVSPYVSASAKVGVRIPDYKIARLLASLFPITTTSANLTNECTLSNPQDILKQIGNDIDLVIDVGDLGKAKPSTVIDLSSSKPTLVRNGFDSNDMDSLKEDLEKLV